MSIITVRFGNDLRVIMNSGLAESGRDLAEVNRKIVATMSSELNFKVAWLTAKN